MSENLLLVLVGAGLTVAQAALGYVFIRHRQERRENQKQEREFQLWVRNTVHALSAQLDRNCTLTSEIHRQVVSLTERQMDGLR